MNPYTFVSLGGPPERRKPAGNGDFSGTTGRLMCTLLARSPIFVAQQAFSHDGDAPAESGHQSIDFPVLPDGRPVLWGTSLRGALRAVCEAASASCLSVFDGVYERGAVDDRELLGHEYQRCASLDSLCPSCRLFGTLGLFRTGYAGNVLVSDAVYTGDGAKPEARISLAALHAPKVHHAAFYRTETPALAGRKFYYHHTKAPTSSIERSRFNRTVQPLPAGTTLHFRLSFTSVAADDLLLLLYALVLRPNLGHKIGMGKPVGLGSATITVRSATVQSARDAALGAAGVRLDGEQLERWLLTQVAEFTASRPTGSLEQLEEVLALDPGRPVAYPSPAWFRDHPMAPLSTVPDVAPIATGPATRTFVPRQAVPSAEAATPMRPWRRPDAGPTRTQPPYRDARPAGQPLEQRAAPSPGVRPMESGRAARDEQPRQPENAGAPQPAETAEERSAPATLADLVKRFSRQPEAPKGQVTSTKESQRARDEQRRLMDRLRRDGSTQ